MLVKKIEEKIEKIVIIFVNACILSFFAREVLFFRFIIQLFGYFSISKLHSFVKIENGLIL